MNEIQPSNIEYVLFSNDDEYYDISNFKRDKFDLLMNSIKYEHELLIYCNAVDDSGRHNKLIDTDDFGRNLLYANRQYQTWFIDDNNDLWCREECYEGVNYYLLREFNTDDSSIISDVKRNINSLYSFDSDIIFEHTNDIGSRIITLLSDLCLFHLMKLQIY